MDEVRRDGVEVRCGPDRVRAAVKGEGRPVARLRPLHCTNAIQLACEDPHR